MDNPVEMVENRRIEAGLAPYALGIFAKQPVAGEVKTRLSPPLSPAEAAELYAVSLRETVTRCQAGGLAPVLFHAGAGDYFRSEFPGLALISQQGGDLGARMAAAFHDLLAVPGVRGAVLIGSDSPDLPLDLLGDAFAALAAHDCVIAPAADGGYVLLGMRRLCPELLSDIPWSSDEVFTATCRRAQRAGLDCRIIGSWEDMDDLPSLRRLLRRSPRSETARHAATQLARLFAGWE